MNILFSHGMNWENLFNNHGIQSLMIILYILKNYMVNLVVTMQGEITCRSLLGALGLTVC